MSIFLINFLLIIAVLLLSPTSSVHAASIDKVCTKVESIFARGSGAGLDEDKGEKRKFFGAINDRLKNSPSVTTNTYELGTESYGGNKYPAVAVNDILYQTTIGAIVSGGQAFKYGDSVKQGVGELQSYLSQRYEKCKSVGTLYVLGGYSQGAQVIGQALPGISKEIRDKIVYVGLFGDPKLYYPEGEGLIPPACLGKDASPWRKAASRCNQHDGTLGARKPYLPDDMKNKTGLWCYKYDSVCDWDALGAMSGHETYKGDGMAIDKAAQEVATKLTAILGNSSGVDISWNKASSAGIDTVFVIDTTGSMNGIIDKVKTYARTSAEKIKAKNGRVALVAYKDLGDTYSSFIFSGFEDDYSTFLSALDNLHIGGGGDTPEATLHALMTAFDELKWKNGATKAAVVLTDATFHNPDKVDGSTIASVAKRSLEIDPVNVYPIVPSNLIASYQELATMTSGQVIDSNGDTVTALDTAMTKIQNRPVAQLKNLEYKAKPGQEITFDASDSYVNDATITKYEWDFNGDGIFETATTTPVVNYIYSATFTGNMQVRLTATNDTWANASATVTVSDAPPPTLSSLSNLTATINSTSANKSVVTINWKIETPATKWVIELNGIGIGNVEGDQTSVQITDIDRTEDVVIGVFGVVIGTSETVQVSAGEHTSTTIPALKSNPTPPILSTCTQSNFFIRLLCKAIALFKTVINGVLYYILPWKI